MAPHSLSLVFLTVLLVHISFLSLCVKGDGGNGIQRRLTGSVDAVNEILAEIELEVPFVDTIGPVIGNLNILPQGSLSCSSFSITDLVFTGAEQVGPTNPEKYTASVELSGLQFQCTLPVKLTDTGLGLTCSEGLFTLSSTPSTSISTFLDLYSQDFDLYAPSSAVANDGKICDDLLILDLQYASSNIQYPFDFVIFQSCIAADPIIELVTSLLDDSITSDTILPLGCGLIENVTNALADVITNNDLVGIINSREVITGTIEESALASENSIQLGSGLSFYNQTTFDSVAATLTKKVLETPLASEIEDEITMIMEDERVAELLALLETVSNMSLPSFFDVAANLADELGFFGNASLGTAFPSDVTVLVNEIIQALDNVTLVYILDLLPSSSGLNVSLPLNHSLLDVITDFVNRLNNVTVGDVLAGIPENTTIYQLFSGLDETSTITDLFADVFALLDGMGGLNGLNSTLPGLPGNSSSTIDMLIPFIGGFFGVEISDSVTSINDIILEVLNGFGSFALPLPGIGSISVEITSIGVDINNETFYMSSADPVGVSSLLLPGIQINDLIFEMGLNFSLNASEISKVVIDDKLLVSISLDAVAQAVVLFAFAYDSVSDFEFGLLESFEELLPISVSFAGCALSSIYLKLSATYVTALLDVSLSGGENSLAGFFFTLINILIDLYKPIIPALVENAVKSLLPSQDLTPIGEGTCEVSVVDDSNTSNSNAGPNMIAVVGAALVAVLVASVAFLLIWRKFKGQNPTMHDAKAPPSI